MPLLFLFYLPASSSSPRFASDLEQARPQTTGEEELQLQLALAMSREEAEKVEWPCLSRGVRHLPVPCLICEHSGSLPSEETGFWGLPEAGAYTCNCTRLLARFCLASKSPAGRWRHGLPCSLFSERRAPGWDLSNLPNPRVTTWLPSSAEDFWSRLLHFSCLPTEVLGDKALPSGLCGCRASSTPGAGGSLQAGAPSHCLGLSNWARRSTGKQPQEELSK